MNWRIKSKIQNACAALPFGQDETYFFLQRTAGALRRPPDPMPMLQACASLVSDLASVDMSVAGKTLMEIGTGRRLEMPLGMFLCGAERVITFDLYPLLREELVMRSVGAMLANRDEVIDSFAHVAPAGFIARRLDLLGNARTLRDVLRITNIDYRAPADATKPDVPDNSIDVQFSYTVFEHVPKEVLEGMLLECHRILAPGGVALHHIDPSDHFAHEDASISLINFLQFTDDQWRRLGGNRFAYHNRLRAPDYESLYREVRHNVLAWQPAIDERGSKLLQKGFPLAPEFRNFTLPDLATVVLRVLSKPSR